MAILINYKNDVMYIDGVPLLSTQSVHVNEDYVL